VRLLRLLGHLLIGGTLLLGFALWRASGRPPRPQPRIVRWWHRRLLPLLGVEIAETQGEPATPALIVANHVSWLDIPVLGSLAETDFLSKSEVRKWPLIGWMSAQAGTLFIKRGGHQTQSLTEQIETRVRQGKPVVIFAEGTTSDGRQVRRFFPRLLASARETGAPVQPVAIRYGSNAEPDPIAPFIGDDNLIAHGWRVLRQPGTRAIVHFLEPIASSGIDRRTLASRCRNAIAAALELPLEAPANAHSEQNAAL
jgi:1-acyl-sn-glycerol-3-phosphate acyltransferase